MLKKILLALGLKSAPAPIRGAAMVWSAVGVVPAIAFLAWKYRDRLRPALGRAKDVVTGELGHVPEEASQAV